MLPSDLEEEDSLETCGAVVVASFSLGLSVWRRVRQEEWLRMRSSSLPVSCSLSPQPPSWSSDLLARTSDSLCNKGQL